MHFAPDTEDTLEFVVDLINTTAAASRSGGDELVTPEQLTALLELHRYSGRFDRDLAELDDVRATRDTLRKVWTLDRDDMVAEVNRMLREANAVAHLARHDDFDWHIHATEPTAPLAERMRVEVAFALIDVIRMNETSRMRLCGADDCEGVFIDLSRNGSKRFCSVRCGNRMNMVAFRERRGA